MARTSAGSAGSASGPAGLLEALDALQGHGAGLLVVAKRERLARDVMKAGAIEVAASSRSARVVSADGVAEGADPTAILLRQLLDSFAQFERVRPSSGRGNSGVLGCLSVQSARSLR